MNSLSYGMSEINVDKYLGKGYLDRSDFEFKKLALRGITIIIASGDTGAGGLGKSHLFLLPLRKKEPHSFYQVKNP